MLGEDALSRSTIAQDFPMPDFTAGLDTAIDTFLGYGKQITHKAERCC